MIEWIKDVWLDNFLDEIQSISKYVDSFNYISMVRKN